MWRLALVFACFFLLAVAPWIAASSHAAGGGVLNDPTEVLSTDRPGQPREAIRAWSRIQLVLFELNSIEGKYKVLPVVLENSTRESIALSKAEDSFTILFGERTVPGIVQLSLVDRPLWDALGSVVRDRLSYPERLGPEDSVMIYVFVRASEVVGLPRGMDYAIKSLGQTLKLRVEEKKKAASTAGQAG